MQSASLCSDSKLSIPAAVVGAAAHTFVLPQTAVHHCMDVWLQCAADIPSSA